MKSPNCRLRIENCKLRIAILQFAVFNLQCSFAAACPFCTALKPTWSQQRESASIVAVGESAGSQERGKTEFRVHQVISGKDRLASGGTMEIPTDTEFQPGALAVLLAREGASERELMWSAIAVNETSLAYFAAAPSLRAPPDQRLKHFLRYLEHDDPAIADDAYQEFGHAAYADVGKLAGDFPYAKFREWLTDRQIPQERKGFYAIALAFATDEKERRANMELLEKIIAEPASDLRAGFDGVLGAYLVLKGEAALDAIEKKYLADPTARDGDVRHVVSALRFYWEYGRDISQPRQRTAMRRLLERPEFAAAAIIDLSRWQDWEIAKRIAGFYDREKYPQPATRQAVIAYLVACPTADGAAALADLRLRDPKGVAEGEQAARLGLLKQ
jgi:hypothetical protein